MGSSFNWDDIRIFLVVARSRSFRSASLELGIAVNTLRRHVSRLEDMSGDLLIARNRSGIALTDHGREFVHSALAMEAAAAPLLRRTRKGTQSASGPVRINVTEGLGTLWIVPRLVPFQRAHPRIILETNCTFREADVSRLEVDLAIQLTPPEQSDLKIARIGYMHVMPFAAPSYVRTFGVPKTLREVEQHKIIEQLSPQLDTNAVPRLFPDREREGFVAFTTNTSTAHLWAVASGAGIGMLPTYVAALGFDLVPVDIPGLRLCHDIWLAYHPDTRRLRRVGSTIDYIKGCFDETAYPWFGKDFVNPQAIAGKGLDPTHSNAFAVPRIA